MATRRAKGIGPEDLDLTAWTLEDLAALGGRLDAELKRRKGPGTADDLRAARVAEAGEILRRQEEDRLAAQAAAKVLRDAEAVRTASAWDAKQRIADRVREILGNEIRVPFDVDGLRRQLKSRTSRLDYIRREHGKWRIGDLVVHYDTEAQAIETRPRTVYPKGVISAIDHSAEIAAVEAEVEKLTAEVAAAPATVLKRQRYRLEVWSRGGDIRVFVSRREAQFGGSLYDYYHTGNAREAPRTARVIHEEVSQAAAARGVTRDEILDALKALCAELCEKYTSLKLEDI